MIRSTKTETVKTDEQGQAASAPEKIRFGEKLARNVALAGILTLTIAAARNAELPQGETVLTAVQGIIEADWDKSLGKISFVSNLLPETVSVFFEPDWQAAFTAPCFGEVTHAWQEAEPYLGYSAAGGQVFAIGAGQVMSIAHGIEEECIVRVRHDDGLESLYYNLAAVNVREGDTVNAAACLGTALPDSQAFVEVRRAGRAVDPTAHIAPRTEAAP